MEKRKLGHTEIEVTCLCLGTMTFGEQNTQPEAHQQIEYALERGINFIDTAEMYPVPPKSETYSKTESIIGNCQLFHQRRQQIILASKVVGPGVWQNYIRDGKPRLNRQHITQALEASLRRLKTDYIDLYQLHWPDRSTNYFGQRGFIYPSENEETTAIEESLHILHELVQSGKIRNIGLSNETPWGIMKFLAISEKMMWPKIVSVQNPYNLLNRTYEYGGAEIAYREKVGLLAYSPMAFGALSGKYLNGQKPKQGRLTRWTRFSRYTNPNGVTATEKYVALAQRNGLSPAQMALAYVTSRPFVTSNIIGATSLEQLKENIDSIELCLSSELIHEIDCIFEEIPNPCP